MKQGTISVLFGCHSPIHSTMVLISWYKIYHKFPSFWELVCIYLHDVGHWGTNYLDNPVEKEQHAILGAKISRKLFGDKGYNFIIGHNAYQSDLRSTLYYPDKYSWIIAPTWWMATSVLIEPKLKSKNETCLQQVRKFKKAMKENERTGFKERGHDIYLKQRKEARK